MGFTSFIKKKALKAIPAISVKASYDRLRPQDASESGAIEAVPSFQDAVRQDRKEVQVIEENAKAPAHQR